MIRDNIPNTIKGVAALSAALACIGAHTQSDSDVAKVVVENELALRDLVRYALNALASDA